eukprot:g10065.t1
MQVRTQLNIEARKMEKNEESSNPQSDDRQQLLIPSTPTSALTPYIVLPPPDTGEGFCEYHNLVACNRSCNNAESGDAESPTSGPAVSNVCSEEGSNLQELDLSQLTDNQQRVCVVMLGMGFLLVYTAFGSAKNYVTKLFGTFGYVSLATFYITFAVCSLAAPSFTGRLGARKCIFGGSVMFLLFLGALILGNHYVLLGVAICSGAAASIFWNGQALYLTKTCLGPNLSKMTGLFFFLYHGNGMLGNFLLGLLLAKDMSVKQCFIVLLGVGAAGSFVLACLPTSHCRSQVPLPPMLTQIRQTFSMFSQGQMRRLIPMFMLVGFLPAIISGAMPPLMSNQLVAFAFLCFSTANLVSSLFCGWLFSKCGWFIVNAIAAAGFTGGMYLAALALEEYYPFGLKENHIFYFMYSLIGVADGAAVTVLTNTVGVAFKDRAPAFGCYRFTMQLTQSLCFLFSKFFEVHILLTAFTALNCIAALSYGLCAMRIDWSVATLGCERLDGPATLAKGDSAAPEKKLRPPVRRAGAPN